MIFTNVFNVEFGSTLHQPTVSSLRRSGGSGDGTKAANLDHTSKRKKPSTSPAQTKRKPTLIRNLGGAGTAKGQCIRRIM
jgi:hypothetical protein